MSGNYPSSSFNESFKFLPTWLTDASYTNVTGGQKLPVVDQGGTEVVFVTGLGERSTLVQPVSIEG